MENRNSSTSGNKAGLNNIEKITEQNLISFYSKYGKIAHNYHCENTQCGMIVFDDWDALAKCYEEKDLNPFGLTLTLDGSFLKKENVPPKDNDAVSFNQNHEMSTSGSCLFCSKKAYYVCSNCQKWLCSAECLLKHKEINFNECRPKLEKANPMYFKETQNMNNHRTNFEKDTESSPSKPSNGPPHFVSMRHTPPKDDSCGRQCLKPSVQTPLDFKGRVSHIVNPYVFYMRDIAKIRGTLVSLAYYEKDVDKNKPYSVPQIGGLCLHYNESEMRWYRSKVIQIFSSTCNIQYLDYGMLIMANTKDLYEIPNQMLTHEKLAMMCRLHGIASVVSKWTNESMQLFLETLKTKVFDVNVVGTLSPGVFEVVLKDSNGNDIKDLLVERVKMTDKPAGCSIDRINAIEV